MVNNIEREFHKRKSFKLSDIYAFRIHYLITRIVRQKLMICKCSECDGEIKIPKDAVNGEIVACPDCGLEFELSIESDGKCNLKVAEVVGEDWGE
jgi:alpha-aminoadipate carrier protein LysW